MKVEILCTGDEVLSGKVINSNYSFMSSKLEEVGITVIWGTTVGDNKQDLLDAFKLASERADAVIVNGGLGPTVDDLSQEVAGIASGNELELRHDWLEIMEKFFIKRGRAMTENNKKQAMLPKGAELINNPIGTACGFAININKSRFFFTPGVPRELFLMLEDEIIPRLIELSGEKFVTRLKTFHSYGIGESRADSLLEDIVSLAPDDNVKLGFQAHFPQLETKLHIRAKSEESILKNLLPVENELRKRLGNYIFAEDKQTLEGLILESLRGQGKTLSIVEVLTDGGVNSRLSKIDNMGENLIYAAASNNLSVLCKNIKINYENKINIELAEKMALNVSDLYSTDFGLCVLINHTEKNEADTYIALSGTIMQSRVGRFIGDNHRVTLGSVEMALDCLRRHFQDLPFEEKSDFER
ncbi:MAG: CinA family nicotinamide mononucleotide deamidase-related protein [Hyphomicrobiales bacterium]|nr:CinA family nicotinamide mononucleotide deamidase-related protein [Hyphomicrobiales bacterium]|tara:strand:+ start:809 stop:2050 length:1242 start_codon:yes stop_codon:yes gene_type:complete